jgi:hypothetical protein
MDSKIYEELKLIKQFTGIQAQLTKELLNEIKGLRGVIANGINRGN